MTSKTTKITKSDDTQVLKYYRCATAEILEMAGRVFDAKKVVISGREYCKTGAGFTYIGRA